MTNDHNTKDKLEIYHAIKGEVVFNVDADHETIWATQEQISQLFDVDRTVVTRHIRNIYKDGELNETATCAKNAQVRMEGDRKVTREVRLYNLDAIISVGYRVNSRKATDFRIWATKVLKQYIVGGVAVNERRLKQLSAEKLKNVENMMSVVRRLIARQELNAGEATGVLEVISKYAGSFQTLREYDDGFIDLSGLNKKSKQQVELTVEMCDRFIAELRENQKGGDLFGKKRGNSFSGSLASVYQSYDGKDLYPSVAEKAANLLYFIIKDHPFYDGNKRIGALLFIVFLTLNNYHLTESGETKISDRALTAIALLIAESKPAEKDLIVNLTIKLLE